MTEKQEETCANCGKTKVLHHKKYSQLRCFDRDFNFSHSEGEYKWVFTPGKKFIPKTTSPAGRSSHNLEPQNHKKGCGRIVKGDFPYICGELCPTCQEKEK